MALQGQSVFNSAGDTGAFGCIRSDGTTIVDAGDPATQPWVTSVGGTSFESDNPGTNPNPAYPAKGAETVWNVDNLCNDEAPAAATTGRAACSGAPQTGAGGGGTSQCWGRPFYQRGPGVNSADTAYSGEVGNGATDCTLAKRGDAVPRDAGRLGERGPVHRRTPSTAPAAASTPYSRALPSARASRPGWFAIGGTSLSTPLWAALIADRDSYTRPPHRQHQPAGVLLAATPTPSEYFNDITGIGRASRPRPTTACTRPRPGYDEATGIGTPKIAAIITGGFGYGQNRQ